MDEFLMGGEIQETSKQSIAKSIEASDMLQEVRDSVHSSRDLAWNCKCPDMLKMIHDSLEKVQWGCQVCFIQTNTLILIVILTLDETTLEMSLHFSN